MLDRVFIFPFGLRTSFLGLEAAHLGLETVNESGLVLGSILALYGLQKNR